LISQKGKWKVREVYRAIVLTLSSVRLVPHILVLLRSSHRDLIWADAIRWSEIYHLGPSKNVSQRICLFLKLMTFYPEFRNVFYFRIGRFGRLFRIFCRPLATLLLESKRIGPRLFIQHGYDTWVSAEEIGENCWINQHVTIGYTNESDRPTIGNNVTINVGARILGKVKLGDGSKVGANSVVISDVPPGVTVMGVPATALWNRKIAPQRPS
jgi:serine O-acetyltransferase